MASFETTTDSGQPVGIQATGGADIEAPAEERLTSRLVFPVGGHGLLLESGVVMEYLEGQSAFHVPNGNPLFEGLVNRRGNLVPVFEVRRLMGGSEQDRSGKKILVLGQGDDSVGVVLDDTPYRKRFSEESEAPPPEELVRVFGTHVGGSFKQDGKDYTEVDIEQFIAGLVNDAR